MEAIVSLIGAALAIGLVFLKMWVSNTPEREKEEEDARIQQGRRDIVEGNVPAVNSRVDQLLSIPEQQSSNPGSVPSTEEAQRRLDAL